MIITIYHIGQLPIATQTDLYVQSPSDLPFRKTVCEPIQVACRIIEGYCEETKLTVNPQKTEMILFSKIRNIEDLKKQRMFEKSLKYFRKRNILVCY